MSTIALARTTFGASTARVPAWIVETATYRAPEGADVDPEGEMDAVDFDRIMGEAETAARAIAAQWEPESPRRAWTTDAKRPDPNTPSKPTFERWASEEPARLLVALTSSELKPTLLTFAAEIAGARLPASEVVPVLLTLLSHTDSAVREGAIYGLARHPGRHIDTALLKLATEDPSPGVREAASATLEDR